MREVPAASRPEDIGMNDQYRNDRQDIGRLGMGGCQPLVAQSEPSRWCYWTPLRMSRLLEADVTCAIDAKFLRRLFRAAVQVVEGGFRGCTRYASALDSASSVPALHSPPTRCSETQLNPDRQRACVATRWHRSRRQSAAPDKDQCDQSQESIGKHRLAQTNGAVGFSFVVTRSPGHSRRDQRKNGSRLSGRVNLFMSVVICSMCMFMA